MQIETRELESRPYVAIREQVARDRVGAFLGPAYRRLKAFLAARGLEPQGPPMALYFAAGESHFDMAAALGVAAPVEGEGEVLAGRTPAGAALVHEHRGHYDQLEQVWPAFDRELAARGRRPRAPCREEYLTDPGGVPDPSHWRTLLVQPLD